MAKRYFSSVAIALACLLAFCMMISLLPAFAGTMQKPRVAIKVPKTGPNVSAGARSSLDLQSLLSAMENALLAARKFDLVSRRKDVLRDIREEQKFAKSKLSAGDAATEGKLQNADYLVLPTVQSFAFYTVTHKVPNLQSKYLRTDHGKMEMSAQIVDTTTGQIKSTFQLTSSFSTPDQFVNRPGGVPARSHYSAMIKKISAQMVDQLLDLVFPVRIIKVQGDRVFLNRGKDGGFKPGMRLKVYTEGEALIDPYTKEVLGAAEEYAGIIKVTRVNPKFTLATIIKRTGNCKITSGCIVRKP